MIDCTKLFACADNFQIFTKFLLRSVERLPGHLVEVEQVIINSIV